MENLEGSAHKALQLGTGKAIIPAAVIQLQDELLVRHLHPLEPHCDHVI